MITVTFNWHLTLLIIIIAIIIGHYISIRNHPGMVPGFVVGLMFHLPAIIVILLIYGGIYWW